jgi:hypothetical protein
MRREEKFGILIPKSVKDALEIDRETGTTFWAEAIPKEMSVIMPAMKILPESAPPPICSQEIPCHMIFDVKSTSLGRLGMSVGDTLPDHQVLKLMLVLFQGNRYALHSYMHR